MTKTQTIYIFSFLMILAFSCKEVDKKTKTLPNKISFPDTSSNGVYVGLEEMPYDVDPDQPERKWYHFSRLKIRGDSTFLDQSPISIGPKGDTLWGSSDGGFFYHYGTVKRQDSIVSFDLIYRFCDYCAEPMLKPGEKPHNNWRRKKWVGTVTKGGIKMNGQVFFKVIDNRGFFSEYPPDNYYFYKNQE